MTNSSRENGLWKQFNLSRGVVAARAHKLNQPEQSDPRRVAVLRGHGNMPAWCDDTWATYWEAVDRLEPDGLPVCREEVFQLPAHLEIAEWPALVRLVVDDLGPHPYQYAIHATVGSTSFVDAHLHLLYSNRITHGFARTESSFFGEFRPFAPRSGGAWALSFEELSSAQELAGRFGEHCKLLSRP